MTSGTAAADLEREEDAYSAGLSANARPKRHRHLARHRLFRKCAVGVLCPVTGVRSRNAPAQNERNRTMKKKSAELQMRIAKECCLLYDGEESAFWACGPGWDGPLEKLSYKLEALNIQLYDRWKVRIVATQIGFTLTALSMGMTSRLGNRRFCCGMLKTLRRNMCAWRKKSATVFARSAEPRLARASLLAVARWDGTVTFAETAQCGMKRVPRLLRMK